MRADDPTLRALAEESDALGLEMLVIGYGWCVPGDWEALPARFPRGLR